MWQHFITSSRPNAWMICAYFVFAFLMFPLEPMSCVDPLGSCPITGREAERKQRRPRWTQSLPFCVGRHTLRSCQCFFFFRFFFFLIQFISKAASVVFSPLDTPFQLLFLFSLFLQIFLDSHFQAEVTKNRDEEKTTWFKKGVNTTTSGQN